MSIGRFLRRATIIASQSYQVPGCTREFKALLFSRKLEKVFRDLYKTDLHKPRGGTEFLQSAAGATPDAGPLHGSFRRAGAGRGPGRRGRARGPGGGGGGASTAASFCSCELLSPTAARPATYKLASRRTSEFQITRN